MKKKGDSISILFEPVQLGNVTIENRFVHAGTYECMAAEDGRVTDDLIRRYLTLASGQIGLIIPGFMFVNAAGKGAPRQIGIHRDDMIRGLKRLADTIHKEASKACFQIAHAGIQTTRKCTGMRPIAPSSVGRAPGQIVRSKQMTEDDIHGVIEAYGKAAGRAAEAGADAVHITCGAGYLPNQFLSPYFNRRSDSWGGSDENRFRFVREVVLNVRKHIPAGMPLVMKLNAHDYTPREGITPPLALKYAGWLSEMGVEALEITSGTNAYSNMYIWRGEVPVRELVRSVPMWRKPFAWLTLKRLAGKHDFEEAWNLKNVMLMKPALRDTRLLLVGGMRRVEHMEEVVEKGFADFISMCRPFIREPLLVRNIRDGKTQRAACVSCNRCVAALANGMPLHCYYKGVPKK